VIIRMNDYQYIPLTHYTPKSTMRFRVEVALDADGWWHAWIAALPGCAAWGDSREEAVERVRHLAIRFEQLNCQREKSQPAAEEIGMPFGSDAELSSSRNFCQVDAA